MVSEGPDWMGATVGVGEDKEGATVSQLGSLRATNIPRWWRRGEVKEPERELWVSRRKPRKGGIREVWKRKFFEKEEVTKVPNVTERLST